MGGDGLVTLYRSTLGTGNIPIKESLEEIKDKCDLMKIPYPEYFCVDNVETTEGIIKEIFPSAKIHQDIKHLMDRPLSTLSKRHDMYYDFAAALGNAITEARNKIDVFGRDGKIYQIKPPLSKGKVIWKRVKNTYFQFKGNSVKIILLFSF